MTTVNGRESIWSAPRLLVAYIACAVVLSLLNAGVLRSFPAPQALAAWHMAVSAALALVSQRFSRRVSTGPTDVDSSATSDQSEASSLASSWRSPVLIGFVTAVWLGFGGHAQLYLSSELLQMLKCSHPLIAYWIMMLAGLDASSYPKLKALLLVSAGELLANIGNPGLIGARGVAVGVFCQSIGSMCECVRIMLIWKLVSNQVPTLDPFDLLFRYASLACLILIFMSCASEAVIYNAKWQTALVEEVGVLWLFASGISAFAFNAVCVLLLQRLDPVAFAVIGTFKDAAVVLLSAMVLPTPVSFQELGGYVLALVAVQIFSFVQTTPELFEGNGGFAEGLIEVAVRFRVTLANITKRDDLKHRARRSAIAFQDELDDELDQDLPSQMEKGAARALGIQLSGDDEMGHQSLPQPLQPFDIERELAQDVPSELEEIAARALNLDLSSFLDRPSILDDSEDLDFGISKASTSSTQATHSSCICQEARDPLSTSVDVTTDGDQKLVCGSPSAEGDPLPLVPSPLVVEAKAAVMPLDHGDSEEA